MNTTDNKQLVREPAREEALKEILENSIMQAVDKGVLPVMFPNDITYEQHQDSDNILLASFNDAHYGAVVDNAWNLYDSDIFKAQVLKYAEEIIHIGETQKSDICYIWANGDLISGNIHNTIAISNKENVIEQIMGVSEIIAMFLGILSDHFREVNFVSVSGNHSRLTPNKKNAITTERLDDLIEWYLAARLQYFSNIHIGNSIKNYEKLNETMYVLTIYGKDFVGIHGDYDPTKTKVMSLATMAEQRTHHPVYAILSAHLHHNKIDQVQGIRTYMGGSFIGMDDYCITNRIIGEPQQLVLVINETGVKCTYDINLID